MNVRVCHECLAVPSTRHQWPRIHPTLPKVVCTTKFTLAFTAGASTLDYTPPTPRTMDPSKIVRVPT